MKKTQMSQLLRLWYLSHRRPAKAQASLHIRAVSPEPSLFEHMDYGIINAVSPEPSLFAHMDYGIIDEGSDQKSEI